MRGMFLLVGSVSLWTMATAVPAAPVISGYGQNGCVAKGSRLTINGAGFRDVRTEARVVLWARGLEVEAPAMLWEDSQIIVRVPDDRRIEAGQQYEIRLSSRRGSGMQVMGPLFTICGEDAAQAPSAPPAGAVAPAQAPAIGAQIANQVMQAGGASHWRNVKKIQFTFQVAQGEKQLASVRHDWDVRGGTDKVTWDGKTVTVNVHKPAADADAQAAYKRWINDTYWLLAPLKLRDSGTNVEYGGREVLDGKPYDVLRLSFGKVGLTSGDRYNLYIDPTSRLVRAWDYLPDAQKKVSGTWEGYQDFGGLKLSTEHKFGDKRVWFTDINVVK